MAFRIKISSRAKADLDAIYRWIRAERSELAFKWYQALKQATRDLAVNPERCPATTEDRLLRHLLYGRTPNVYRMIFRVVEKPRRVEIVHIRHGARKAFTTADLN